MRPPLEQFPNEWESLFRPCPRGWAGARRGAAPAPLQLHPSGAIGATVARASCGGESEETQAHLPHRLAPAAVHSRRGLGPDGGPAGRRRGAGSRRRAAVQAPAAGADQGERQVAFSANQVIYEDKTELVTASGDVRMNSEGNNLRADRVVWNRKSDEVAGGRQRPPRHARGQHRLRRQRRPHQRHEGRRHPEPPAGARGWRPPRRRQGGAQGRLYHALPRRLFALRGAESRKAARRIPPGRSTRSRSSTTRSSTASIMRAPRSSCSERGSSPFPSSRIPTARARPAAACSFPSSG